MLGLYALLACCLTGAGYFGWRWWMRTHGALDRRLNRRLDHLSAAERGVPRTPQVMLSVMRGASPQDDSKLDLWLAPWLYQAGLKQRRARHYLMLHAYLGGMMALALALAQGLNLLWWVSLLLIVALPPACIHVLSVRQQRRIEAELPQLIDDMVNALQAGHTLSTMWQGLARHASPALRGSALEMAQRLAFGESLDLALQSWARHSRSAELRFFIAALRIQHQSGGNPMPLLQAQAGQIRARLAMQQAMMAATSEARLSAWILALLPWMVAAVMAAVAPQRMTALLWDPQGQVLLQAALLFELLGVVWLLWLLRVRT